MSLDDTVVCPCASPSVDAVHVLMTTLRARKSSACCVLCGCSWLVMSDPGRRIAKDLAAAWRLDGAEGVYALTAAHRDAFPGVAEKIWDNLHG